MPPTRKKRFTTVENRKHTLERNILYFSMIVQATLTFAVVGFCAYQLNRCPVNDGDTSDSGGIYDSPQCPRALYTTMMTSAIASWFPAPFVGLIQAANQVNANEQAEARAKRKPTTKEGDSAAPLDK